MANEVRKYKNVIKDGFNSTTYEIYSNRKLSRKEMLREIREYYYQKRFPEHACETKILIISNDK
jgi:hypothetical protein